MIEVAGEVRRLFVGQRDDGPAIELTFSTRTLVRWAYLTLQFGAPQPLHHALKRALTGRAEPETAEAIHGIVQRLCGDALMAAPAITVLLYRMRNPNGTSKDWAVPTVLDPQRLTVYFGRTGSTLRQAETPAGRCRDGIPIREAEDRIREKWPRATRPWAPFGWRPTAGI